jgi:hypothetical protein
MRQITNRAESNQPNSHVWGGVGRILRWIVATALAVVGTVVLVVGFYLGAFKKIEGIPTSPLAREITMFTGALILSVGLALLGKRAIFGTGILMILTGIATYALGFTSDGPLSLLLPFAGAFVVALGFVIIAFNAGWLRDD